MSATCPAHLILLEYLVCQSVLYQSDSHSYCSTAIVLVGPSQ